MNNGRFAISLHILTLLDQSNGEVLSSEYIAGSININPVLVRKELISLRNQGLVLSKEGKNGGSYLAKPSTEITLAEIYNSVKQISLLGQAKNTPNPKCPNLQLKPWQILVGSLTDIFLTITVIK
eukprot:gene13467-15870_t